MEGSRARARAREGFPLRMSGIDNSYKIDGDVLLVIRASILPRAPSVRSSVGAMRLRKLRKTTPVPSRVHIFHFFRGWGSQSP